MNLKAHWEKVFETRGPEAMSWTQALPSISLRLIAQAGLPPGAHLLDVGAGLGNLAVALQGSGLRLTLLDLSREALDRARLRLGEGAAEVTWLEGDITRVALEVSAFDLWHDRAVFHFLTEEADRDRYRVQLRKALHPGGAVILATFGPEGPERCSGLPVRRHRPEDLAAFLGPDFLLESAEFEEHGTPMGTTQSFTWTLFRRRS